MRPRLGAAMALAIAAPAPAAERAWSIGSITRLRVEAPVAVRVVTDGGNGVRATADDPATLVALEVIANGDTLLIRQPRGTPPAPDAPRTIVTVDTPRLEAAAVYSAARTTIDAMRGDRIVLSVTEGGSIAVTRIEAPAVAATLAGKGAITLAGTAGDVRLIANGAGTLDAAGLVADRLNVQALDAADVTASARFAATVNAAGTARVAITTRVRCAIRRGGDAQVTCDGGASNPR